MATGHLADLLVLFHLAFVAFAIVGGLLALRWPRAAWVHLPCAAWAVLIELFGWLCPLTPLEVHLRRLAGQEGYAGGFLEHYVVPVLYPAGLTRSGQVVLALALLTFNAAVYAAVRRRWRGRARTTDR